MASRSKKRRARNSNQTSTPPQSRPQPRREKRGELGEELQEITAGQVMLVPAGVEIELEEQEEILDWRERESLVGVGEEIQELAAGEGMEGRMIALSVARLGDPFNHQQVAQRLGELAEAYGLAIVACDYHPLRVRLPLTHQPARVEPEMITPSGSENYDSDQPLGPPSNQYLPG